MLPVRIQLVIVLLVWGGLSASAAAFWPGRSVMWVPAGLCVLASIAVLLIKRRRETDHSGLPGLLLLVLGAGRPRPRDRELSWTNPCTARRGSRRLPFYQSQAVPHGRAGLRVGWDRIARLLSRLSHGPVAWCCPRTCLRGQFGRRLFAHRALAAQSGNRTLRTGEASIMRG